MEYINDLTVLFTVRILILVELLNEVTITTPSKKMHVLCVVKKWMFECQKIEKLQAWVFPANWNNFPRKLHVKWRKMNPRMPLMNKCLYLNTVTFRLVKWNNNNIVWYVAIFRVNERKVNIWMSCNWVIVKMSVSAF